MDTRESSDWIAATSPPASPRRRTRSRAPASSPLPPSPTSPARTASPPASSSPPRTIPGRTTASSSSAPTAYKLPDSTELAIEAEIFRRLAASHPTCNLQPTQPPPRQRGRPRRVHPLPARRRPRPLARRPPHRRRLRQRSRQRHRPPALRRTLGGGEVILTHASPNGRNINEAAAPSTPKSSPPKSSNTTPPWASPSTATPTARSSPTSTARSSTATPSCCSPPATCRPRPARQRHRRRHHHVQHGPRSRAEALRHQNAPRPRRRQVRPRADALHRRGPRRRAVRPHHLLRPLSTTGDGLLTALLCSTSSTAAANPRRTHRRPQDLPPGHRQRPRPRKEAARPIPTVAAAIAAAELALAGTGRVVIRYSGTEALARVMIEAESEPLMRHHADRHRRRHPHRTSNSSSSCTCSVIRDFNFSSVSRRIDANHRQLDQVRRRPLQRRVDRRPLGKPAHVRVARSEYPESAAPAQSIVRTACSCRTSPASRSINRRTPHTAQSKSRYTAAPPVLLDPQLRRQPKRRNPIHDPEVHRLRPVARLLVHRLRGTPNTSAAVSV
jgi:phosphoglucosamine mutase